MHIPQVAPGFWEKFYFRPGNLGYPVFDTRVGKVGVYICYDRHFPEVFRSFIMQGATMVLVPTAVAASEPFAEVYELEMRAAAVTHGVYIGMANRAGTEGALNFLGQSMVIDPQGQLVTELDTEQDRVGGLEAAKKFVKLGFKIFATEGTQAHLSQHGVEATLIKKMHEGRPNIADAIKNEEIQLVVNTPIGRLSAHDDSYIRKAAIKHKIPYITTTAAANAAAEGIAACSSNGKGKVCSLQEYHKQL